MRRPFAVLPLVVGLALVASCGDQPAPDGSVTRIVVAEPDWQGARAIGHVPAAIMEERLGFEVELVSVTSAEAPLDAMARGDGKGEYWRGPPDWNSTRIQLVKAESYGYAPNFASLPLTDDEFTTIRLHPRTGRGSAR